MKNRISLNERRRAGYMEGAVSVLVNTLLFSTKLYVGVASNSIAIIGDAFHTFSDSLTSIALILGYKVASKPPDAEHPFGHGRFELVTNLVIGVLLAVVGYEIAKSSIDKLLQAETYVYSSTALVVLVISAIIKLGLALWAYRLGSKFESKPVKSDAWHHASDTLVTLIVATGLYAGRGYWYIDSLLGISISAIIVYVAYRIMRDTSSELLGRGPTSEEINAIREIISKIHGSPLSVHHVHVHQYGDHVEITMHIKLPGKVALLEAHEIATRIENEIRERLGYEATVHIEPIEDTEDHRD